MDAERRAEIRRWAARLAEDESAEQRAAGRALLLLVDENEALLRRLAETEEDGPAPPAAPSPPREGRSQRTRTARPRRPRPLELRRLPWRRVAVLAVLLALLVAGGALATAVARPGLETGGIAHGALLGAQAAAAPEVWARAGGGKAPTWRLDGRPATATQSGGRWVLRPGRLADGDHVVEVTVGGRWPSRASRTIAFTVDTKAPTLELAQPAAARRGEPVRIAGRTEPGGRAFRAGKPVPVDADGRFRLQLPAGAAGRAVVLELADRAGNRSRWRVPVSVVPRRPVAPVRSVHVTPYAWADDDLREGVLALIRAKKINAVELDLKDESGLVGWDAPVPYGRKIGAVQEVYDLPAAVKRLHGLGVRVIGRIVCFRDPIHAAAAWKAGRRDEVVQAPDGTPYAEYGGFTNFANPAVRKYNIDVAVAAAKLGVDEILYDYIRRPDGPIASMRFPSLKGTPERAITTFLEESRRALAPTGALVGASVFGIAATRPKEIAQDVPSMARNLDYVAPMVYPSHWGPGEYGVADPNGSPYAIVRRSLVDFVRQTRGTGARVVPWLQDFSYGRTYGAAEVSAQIRAARDAGLDEFILWDAGVTYTPDALEPTATLPNHELTTAVPKGLPGPKRLPGPTPRQDAPAGGGAGPVSGLPPNELGVVPVLMHHEVKPDRAGSYDQTPKEFRAELDWLWREGYAPISASDLVAGRIDLPAGKSPVVLTFDDSTTSQLQLDAAGAPLPDTAVGILLDFARTHPGFEPKATFYVLREPFGGTARSAEHLRWLAEHGFELGNHSRDHVPLGTLSPAGVQGQLAAGARLIQEAVPGYRITTMALPLGSMPEPPRLAVRGSAAGRSYGPYAVFLVGANPAPSPFAKAFDPAAIPRIRTSHLPWASAEEFTFAYWMRALERNPGQRFVSDGDARTIAVPRGAEGDVAARFRARVVPPA